MTNKLSAEAFKHLRIYERLPFSYLVNQIACNRFMKLNYLVEKAPAIYQFATKIFGRNLTNSVVQNTYCKVFTAGTTVQQANQYSSFYRSMGIPVILDYCAQGDIHKPDLQDSLDANAALFADSARLMEQCQNHMISIKITGLLDMRVMKKWNDAADLRNEIFREYSSQEKIISYDGLVAGLKAETNCSDQDIKQYFKAIHNYEGDGSDFNLHQFQFKINHRTFYIYDLDKNSNKVMQTLFPLTQPQVIKIKNFIRRLDSIVHPSAQSTNNFRILVDAEQTYVQRCIESISQQLQQKYNKERAYIIPTIQNYLKRSLNRGNLQIKMAKYKNLKFGAKLVRGAYIVEETRLAKENNYENPVVDCFDFTTQNYLTNFRNMITEFKDGEVVVATHNTLTVDETIKIKEEEKSTVTVSFAQLMGLADHLTWDLKTQNHTVYKYLPWAQTEVMVPYMIRRAQELNQMRYPLDIQYDLQKHQLWTRIKPF